MAAVRLPASFGRQHYQNSVPTVVGLKGSFFDVLWRFIFENRAAREPRHPLGPFKTDVRAYEHPTAGLRVTWMGHSTVLLEMDGKRILFDPMWGERASFVTFAGPRRFFPPPLTLSQLPKLDAIVLSHDHYDHLDASTWRALAKKPAMQNVPVFTSLGVGKYLTRFGYPGHLVSELDWTNTAKIGGSIELTCLPARHFSGRAIWNRNGTLWSSFALKSANHNIYFGADSGPFEECFSEIGQRFGPFDLTMLEIGAYGRQWPDIHMGPQHAVKAHQLLRGRLLFPIHWGTFNLAMHPWKEPVEQIIEEAAKCGFSLLLPAPGIPTIAEPGTSRWWD